MWKTTDRTNQRQSWSCRSRLAHLGRSHGALLALLLAAFSFRLVWVLAFQTPPGPDAVSYDELGWRLASGQGYVDDDGRPTAYWPVGYPALLSVVYLVWGHSWLAAGLKMEREYPLAIFPLGERHILRPIGALEAAESILSRMRLLTPMAQNLIYVCRHANAGP